MTEIQSIIPEISPDPNCGNEYVRKCDFPMVYDVRYPRYLSRDIGHFPGARRIPRFRAEYK